MEARNQTRNFIFSLGLMVTFLYTALVLPIVSSASTESEVTTCAVKSQFDAAQHSIQLLLAEKECEEDDIDNAHSFSCALTSKPLDQIVFSSSPVEVNIFYARLFITTEVPIYLAKRTLLI